jgi:adenylate cyclase
MATDDPAAGAAPLTIDELAHATATPADTLRAWQGLGLLSSRGNALAVEDIERVRLLEFAQQRGVPPEAVARASETQGDLLGEFVASMLGERHAGPVVSLAEAAQVTGLDAAMVRRIWIAAGLGGQHKADQDDLDVLRGLRRALDVGLPEDALIQIVRVFADALGRVADSESRLFHYYVHERLRAQGLAGPELLAAGRAVSGPLRALLEPTVLYFHRNSFRRALREELLVHLAEEATPPPAVPGEIEATILFVDLSGFTPLTEAMGDAAAATLMERFSDLVREAALRCHGRVVKQIGDEFMLAFRDPRSALSFGLEIEAAASAEAQFPAVRMGAHHGAVLHREGDYIGATVNVAARVAAEADRHQFLITDGMRAAAGAIAGVEVEPVGARAFKGIAERLDVYQVRRSGQPPRRAIDPVCLMELDPAGAAARLTWHGTELQFCSDECLSLFVAAPDRYVASPR